MLPLIVLVPNLILAVPISRVLHTAPNDGYECFFYFFLPKSRHSQHLSSSNGVSTATESNGGQKERGQIINNKYKNYGEKHYISMKQL